MITTDKMYISGYNSMVGLVIVRKLHEKGLVNS